MSDATVNREESHQLICLLARMIGDTNVTIKTLGGFLFVGTLTRIDDELAHLSQAFVFTPGGATIPEGAKTPEKARCVAAGSAVVNLETLTGVGKFFEPW